MNDIRQARRSVLKGIGGLSLAGLPLGGIPLAVVLTDAGLARAAAAGLETVSLSGQSAALALPTVTPAPAVLLVHEWWGLNDQIKSVTRALADAGYVALAIDLYDGKVATNADDARSFMGQVQAGAATATLGAWIDWLQTPRPSSAPWAGASAAAGR
ncbi:MAG: dienelactone hydrolase family protein [Alphaproteobacteria bacterium]|jgi:carboxymethylenebutenolidase